MGGLHWWDVEVEVSTGTASANATSDGSDILMELVEYQIVMFWSAGTITL